jgi:hypothetical protein
MWQGWQIIPEKISLPQCSVRGSGQALKEQAQYYAEEPGCLAARRRSIRVISTTMRS